MKTLRILAIFAFTFITANICAQTEVTPAIDVNQMAAKKTGEIVASVSRFTTDQETLISTIELNYAESVQAAFATNNIDNDAIHKEILRLREDRDMKIKSVLDDDQYIQYLKLEEKNQANWKGDNSTSAYEY